MQRIDDDIKATVKKIIQGNEKRKRRMLNGNASAFDHMGRREPGTGEQGNPRL